MRTKTKAAIVEGDNIICLTKVQIGKNHTLIEMEFLLGGSTQYKIFINLNASDARGLMIAVKIRANIQIVDTVKDDEDIIILVKAVVGNETITVGCIYDDNKNNTRILPKLEELLEKIDGRQGLVIGGD